jgi:hypothetical protein
LCGRYEREYQAWLTAREDLDEVLNKGVDLKKVKRRLADLGFKHEAYISFVDVWRKDSPRQVLNVEVIVKHRA